MMRPDRCNHLPRYLLLLALLACASATAAAQLYDVEVIIFSQNGAGGSEQTTAAGAPAQARGAFPPGDFTELTSGSYRLNNIRGGLSAARGYHVLSHRAWRQPGYDRAHAVDYPVHAQAGNGRDSVDGTITLIRERYLHLDLDLRLMTSGGDMPALYPNAPDSRPAYRLVESRRIRSSETHYFDHPRFGVIVRVTPYGTGEEPAPAAETVPEDAAAGAQEEEPAPADDQLTR